MTPMPQDPGRVAVVMGGNSGEREVSLNSGSAVLAALQSRGVDAFAVDGIESLLGEIEKGRVERVFNIIHGAGGEDGQLQGVLDALEIPYTGSGVLGAAISMDKAVSKELWLHHELPTSPFHLVRTLMEARAAIAGMGLPVVVKPVAGGSSIGVGLVREINELELAFAAAQVDKDDSVMIEPLLDGGEYTVAILHGQALPIVRIRPAREFYDYQAKYIDDDTAYECPADLNPAVASRVSEVALAAFAALRLHGWGRIDFLRASDGSFQLLEANTTPGMTTHSLVPKAAAAAGIDFEELCMQILATSWSRS